MRHRSEKFEIRLTESGKSLAFVTLKAKQLKPLSKMKSWTAKFSKILGAAKVLFIFTLCFFLAGCASDVANRYYGTEKFEAKKAKEVEILWESPSRDFTVIADFQSRGESPKTMQNKAAKIGADAVIVSTLGGLYNLNEQWAGTDKQGNTYSRITGTAIRYK